MPEEHAEETRQRRNRLRRESRILPPTSSQSSPIHPPLSVERTNIEFNNKKQTDLELDFDNAVINEINETTIDNYFSKINSNNHVSLKCHNHPQVIFQTLPLVVGLSFKSANEPKSHVPPIFLFFYLHPFHHRFRNYKINSQINYSPLKCFTVYITKRDGGIKDKVVLVVNAKTASNNKTQTTLITGNSPRIITWTHFQQVIQMIFQNLPKLSKC